MPEFADFCDDFFRISLADANSDMVAVENHPGTYPVRTTSHSLGVGLTAMRSGLMDTTAGCPAVPTSPARAETIEPSDTWTLQRPPTRSITRPLMRLFSPINEATNAFDGFS